jgi:hypothetical protein
VGKRDEVHVVAALLPCCLPGGIIGSGCEDSDGYGWGEIRAREAGSQGSRSSYGMPPALPTVHHARSMSWSATQECMPWSLFFPVE